jgi:predicted ArsR family transcriptional regulator
MPETVELRDARALRAVAHPLRLSLIALLRIEGPLTATQAARRLGTTPQLCTFHLGQLAKHGLVEDAGGGRGRERPWRATARATSWPNVAPGPEMAAATELLESLIADRYYQLIRAWIAHRAAESRQWQEAAQFGDSLLYLTPDELASLGRRIREFVEPYGTRNEHPEQRPEGARPVAFLHLAFPARIEDSTKPIAGNEERP